MSHPLSHSRVVNPPSLCLSLYIPHYSTLKVACEGGREVMDGFLASLGNKLYTTDANDK